MLADGRIRAVGTVEELSKSDDEIVYDFFHRVPPDYVEAGDGGNSVLDGVADGQ